MRRNFLLMMCAFLLLGGCKKDKDVHVAKVQAETPDVTTTANAATISGTYNYASTLKSVVIVYGKDASLSSPQKVTAEHTRDRFIVTINNLESGTTYYYHCIFDTGYGASESEQWSFTTYGGGDYAYVDLGLPSGLLWATCNIGANSHEDYGDHFAWGETETKSTYSWNTYKWCNGSKTTLTKYNTKSSYGTVDNRTTLELTDDAAHVNWGDGWRMPTEDEWRELRNNCTWTPIYAGTHQSDKISGYRVTGPNGCSLFLPVSGFVDDANLWNRVYDGLYWSSSLISSNPYRARNMHFSYRGANLDSDSFNYGRYLGYTVRPVHAAQK